MITSHVEKTFFIALVISWVVSKWRQFAGYLPALLYTAVPRGSRKPINNLRRTGDYRKMLSQLGATPYAVLRLRPVTWMDGYYLKHNFCLVTGHSGQLSEKKMLQFDSAFTAVSRKTKTWFSRVMMMLSDLTLLGPVWAYAKWPWWTSTSFSS